MQALRQHGDPGYSSRTRATQGARVGTSDSGENYNNIIFFKFLNNQNKKY